MQTVVHLGAGNIGRGFIGNILSRAGYRVLFADVSPVIIPALQERGRYIVEEAGATIRESVISPVTGLFSSDPALLDAIAEAPLVTTAVGPNILPIIAPTIAAGLRRRRERGIAASLNVIACENMIGGSTALKTAVLANDTDGLERYITENVGFPDSAVDRIVPPMAPSDDPLRVRVEEFSEWIVDGTALVGPVPDIEGMELTDRLEAFIQRKLFTLNTGHAITAYSGKLRGYSTIQESIADPAVEKVVRGAMEESGEVLIRRYGFDRAAHARYIEKILARFRNPYLVDEVTRVGREPLRKLGAADRFMKPLAGTVEYGLPRKFLLQGVVAALAYRNSEDPQAQTMAERLQQEDPAQVIGEYTGQSGALLEELVQAYRNLPS